MAWKCSECGARVKKKDAYCSKCGAEGKVKIGRGEMARRRMGWVYLVAALLALPATYNDLVTGHLFEAVFTFVTASLTFWLIGLVIVWIIG